jgi:hypothetical protein
MSVLVLFKFRHNLGVESLLAHRASSATTQNTIPARAHKNVP